MDIRFITSIAVIAPHPPKSRELYVDALGLPLEASPGSEYFHSERMEGSKHFGVWPLSEAAQACFGTPPRGPARRAISPPTPRARSRRGCRTSTWCSKAAPSA